MTGSSGFPIDDWQFWVATIAAIAALGAILRPMLPTQRPKKDANCPGCPGTGASKDTSKPRRVDLTIGGRRVR